MALLLLLLYNVLAAAATRGFTMVLFTEPVSRRNTFVGGTCATLSALLVCLFVALKLLTASLTVGWLYLTGFFDSLATHLIYYIFVH